MNLEELSILVVGSRGTGKSTIIKNIVEQFKLDAQLIYEKKHSFFKESMYLFKNFTKIDFLNNLIDCEHKRTKQNSIFTNLNKSYKSDNITVVENTKCSCSDKVICVSFREIQSEELYTDNKLLGMFFNKASIAFVVTCLINERIFE